MLATAATLAATAMDFLSWSDTPLRLTAGAHGALVFAFLSWQAMFAAIAVVSVYVLLRWVFGHVAPERPATVQLAGLFIAYAGAQGAASALLTGCSRGDEMRRWAFTLGGLVVRTAHFFGVYGIASLADVLADDRHPAWLSAGLVFKAATVAVALSVLGVRAARASSGGARRFMNQLAAAGRPSPPSPSSGRPCRR